MVGPLRFNLASRSHVSASGVRNLLCPCVAVSASATPARVSRLLTHPCLRHDEHVIDRIGLTRFLGFSLTNGYFLLNYTCRLTPAGSAW